MHGNGGGFDTKYTQEPFGGAPSPASPSGRERVGVGLALWQRLVERHGGRLWATYREVYGRTFHFPVSCEGLAASDIGHGSASPWHLTDNA